MKKLLIVLALVGLTVAAGAQAPDVTVTLHKLMWGTVAPETVVVGEPGDLYYDTATDALYGKQDFPNQRTGWHLMSLAGSGVSPTGTLQVQYNNAGALGGISNSTSGFVLTSNGAGAPPTFQASTGVTGSIADNQVAFGNSTAISGSADLTWDGTLLTVTGTVQSAYKSSDGTAGATVTTCTGFKDGLCISGTP